MHFRQLGESVGDFTGHAAANGGVALHHRQLIPICPSGETNG